MFRLGYILIFFLIVNLLSCSTDSTISSPDPTGDVATASLSFPVPANLQSKVSSAEAIVSATDMDTIQQALTVTQDQVSGIINNIPSGSARKFEVFVYDSTNTLTFEGEAITDIEANQTLTLDIILYPVSGTGTVIINGTFYQGGSTSGRIVFLSDAGGSDDIYIINGDQSGQAQLTNTGEFETHPHISFDRSQICFTKPIAGISRPFVMNADASNLRELPIHVGYTVTHLVWSPDAQDIVFSSDASGTQGIYIYNMNNETITQLTSNNARNWLPTWSPDGEKIGWASDQTGTFKTYIMNRNGSGQMRLTNTTNLEERALEFSPDGNAVVFVGRSELVWDLYKVNTDGSNLEQVTNTPSTNEFHHCWSPDGRFILTAAQGPSEDGLYLIDMLNNYAVQSFLDTPGISEDHAHWR